MSFVVSGNDIDIVFNRTSKIERQIKPKCQNFPEVIALSKRLVFASVLQIFETVHLTAIIKNEQVIPGETLPVTSHQLDFFEESAQFFEDEAVVLRNWMKRLSFIQKIRSYHIMFAMIISLHSMSLSLRKLCAEVYNHNNSAEMLLN